MPFPFAMRPWDKVIAFVYLGDYGTSKKKPGLCYPSPMPWRAITGYPFGLSHLRIFCGSARAFCNVQVLYTSPWESKWKNWRFSTNHRNSGTTCTELKTKDNLGTDKNQWALRIKKKKSAFGGFYYWISFPKRTNCWMNWKRNGVISQ